MIRHHLYLLIVDPKVVSELGQYSEANDTTLLILDQLLTSESSVKIPPLEIRMQNKLNYQLQKS